MNKISTKSLTKLELETLSQKMNSLWWNPVFPAIGICLLIIVFAPFLPIIPTRNHDIASSIPEYWAALKHVIKKLPLPLLFVVASSFIFHYLRDLKLYLDIMKDRKSLTKYVGHIKIIDKKRFRNSYQLKTDDSNIKWIKVDGILYNSININSIEKIIVSISHRAYRNDFKEREQYNDNLI